MHSVNLSNSKGRSSNWAKKVCLGLIGIAHRRLAHSFRGYKQGIIMFDLIMEEQEKA